jgi:flavin-dependent dehydrogenase
MAQSPQPERPKELRWLYERLLGRLPLLRRLPTRRSVLVQLLLMELLALGSFFELRLGWDVAVAGSLTVVAVALWSELLLVVAPALRVPLPPLTGEAARVIHAYRTRVFHRLHAEAAPGVVIFLGVAFVLMRPGASGSAAMIRFLGAEAHPARLAVEVLVLLLTWDVCYRQGVAAWVGGLSAWRAWRLCRAELMDRPADRPRPEWLYHFRRLDRRLLWFPATNTLLLPAALRDPLLLILVALGTAALAALLIVALVYDGRLWHRTPAAHAPRSVRGIRQRSGGEHREPWPDPLIYPRLTDGARVAIIGAGPAGTFCAHLLREHARRVGLGLQMTIFDAKDFTQPGPRGCNMCGGVVAGTLLRRMGQSGLRPPETVVQSEVDGFQLDTIAGSVRLHTDDPDEHMATVFRGNGPRDRIVADNVSFDDYLLDAVRGPDLLVVNEPVTDIALPTDPDESVRLAYGRGTSKAHLEADVVVGAFGLGGRLARRVEELGFGYRAPETVIACQAELLVGEEHIRENLHGDIQIVNLGFPDVAFMALIPKGEFLTFTLVGYRDMGLADLHIALEHPAVRRRLPPNWEIPLRFCHCHPRLPISNSSHPYANRFVIVGDAACSRLYKNGLESAFNTAAFAAHTILHRGVSAAAFEDHYLPACRRVIMRDNAFGAVLFRLNRLAGRHLSVAAAVLSLLEDARDPATERLRAAVWALFAGSLPYRWILQQLAGPGVVLPVLGRTLAQALRRGPSAPAATPAPD